ncbi:kinase-like domain-containing protein [Entophlyctis helioformis]|nr:kinase-like domain-containing protein [Entophlyctis helioformis]
MLASGQVLLGECIGRGASAAVFRGLNLSTGQTVAVKQLYRSNLLNLEIDLLKQLRHPNIVALLGYEATDSALHVIMEYCENGSLQETIKKFGNVPENLVSLYMKQVLQGLAYLHRQGVIHRDVKSANILSTKDGVVKLADFGIATRLNVVDDAVVGSAYWMAPEVIELRGASTASDIWSVGCTSIELFTGQPPYHSLAPVSALFRIVSDDHPPIPRNASPLFVSFLIECFQRDPHLRISAASLSNHAWLGQAKVRSDHLRLCSRSYSTQASILEPSGRFFSRLGDSFDWPRGPCHNHTLNQQQNWWINSTPRLNAWQPSTANMISTSRLITSGRQLMRRLASVTMSSRLWRHRILTPTLSSPTRCH